MIIHLCNYDYILNLISHHILNERACYISSSYIALHEVIGKLITFFSEWLPINVGLKET